MTLETPNRTLNGAIDALFLLGIDFRAYPTAARWSIHDLLRDDPELLERVLVSIANADQNTRIVWEHYFATMPPSVIDHIPNHERMIANAALTARILEAIHPDVFTGQNRFFFQTTAIAGKLEKYLRIRTGDARYSKVQAGIIYGAITDPDAIIRNATDQWYRDADRTSLKLIEENMESVLSILPELCKRKDRSAETIEYMLSVAPSLAEGAI